MSTAPLSSQERLLEVRDRLSLFSSLLWATGAGSALELTPTDTRTLGGYLEELSQELDLVAEAELQADPAPRRMEQR